MKKFTVLFIAMVTLTMLLAACATAEPAKPWPTATATATQEPRPTATTAATAATATPEPTDEVDQHLSWDQPACNPQPTPASNWAVQDFGVKEIKKDGKKIYYPNHGYVAYRLSVVIRPGDKIIEKVIETSGGKAIDGFGIGIPADIQQWVSIDPHPVMAMNKPVVQFSLKIVSGWETVHWGEYNPCEKIITGHLSGPKNEEIPFEIRIIFDPSQQ